MKTLSLFSGCGGLDLGAEEGGASIVAAYELMNEACQTLRKHLKGADVVEADIKGVVSFPKADLVIGGYPCQSFSMGGNRRPRADARTQLYTQFARCLTDTNPKFFIAENVSGLKRLQGGNFLREQVEAFEQSGATGYRVTVALLDAKNFGVPQTRKRVFLVGVRKDLDAVYHFPSPTHGKPDKRNPSLLPYASHGDAIEGLPLWPDGEFYERPHDPEGHFSWYYMSRNRKGKWGGPSFTIVANWRHVTLHPASPVMTLTWSNLADGWKQRWDFSGDYEHLTQDHPDRPILRKARRLSWRECALIQTFPKNFEPEGDTQTKITQIGNAVPPLLAKVLVEHLISERGLYDPASTPRDEAEKQLMKLR